MKRLTFLFLLLIALAMQSISYADTQTQDQAPVANTKQKLQLGVAPIPDNMKQALYENVIQAGDGGNEYWCIYPPNDPYQVTGAGSNMALYVMATKKGTPVRFETWNGTMLYDGIIQEDYGGVVFCVIPGVRNGQNVIDNYAELTEDDEDVPADKGFRISTDEGYEIYVYGGSSRGMTADGYLALPTTGLGNRYVVNTREDYSDYSVYKTGFAALAINDNTKITCKLQWSAPYCITANGRKRGTTFNSPTLARGQVFVVMNALNETKNSTCDPSGTICYSSQNFAFYSFHQRCGIPVQAREHDHLSEQMLPISKWGRNYISVQPKGAYESTSYWKGNVIDENPGQIYRVTASEPETEVTAIWYDLLSLEPAGIWTPTLNYEGEYQEFLTPSTSSKTGYDGPNTPPAHSVMGACRWTSTKPVQIMCYMPSLYYWYNTAMFDPYMVLLTPLEQFGNNTTFQTMVSAGSVQFSEHYVNVYAEGATLEDGTPDTLNYNNNKDVLETVTLREGSGANSSVTRVSLKDNAFLSQRIPGTNYYFARVKLAENMSYRLEGKTRLSGIVYGFGSAISYGWPTSMKLIAVGTDDNLPPEVRHNAECNRVTRPDQNGRVIISQEWIDTTDWEKSQWENKQVDMGINVAPKKIYDETNNLELYRYYYYNKDGSQMFPPSQSWRTGTYFNRGRVDWILVDPFVDVNAAVSFEDGAGNETIDTLIYRADKIAFLDKSGNVLNDIDFGSVVMGSKYFDTIFVKNLDTNAGVVINIDSIFLVKNLPSFKIEEGLNTKTLGPGEQRRIIVSYEPASSAGINDILEINTVCLYFQIPIYAGSGMPAIRVTDASFGQWLVGSPSEYLTVNIRNEGSMDLVVTGYYFDPVQDLGTFTYIPAPPGSDPSATNSWVIPPGSAQARTVRNLRFTPPTTGVFSARLVFISNAADVSLDPERKDYALLTGEGIQPGPKVTNYNFEEKRVLTVNTGEVILTNIGNTPITIASFPERGSWTLRGDTLYNSDNSYWVPNVSGYAGKVVYSHDDESIPLTDREISIKVGFTPRSEYEPIGSCPTLDKFYINFDKNSNVEDNTVYSELSGRGILPKITPSGYTWTTPTEKKKQSDEIGYITIVNPSQTAELKINSIVFGNSGQEGDFTPEISFASLANSTVLRGDSIEIPVQFLPDNTNPPNRVAMVIIDNDGTTGPAVNPVRKDTVYLRATAYDEGLMVTGFDFGTITRCDSPSGNITVVNSSTTTPMTLINVVIDPEFDGIFTMTNPVKNVTIQPGNSYVINVTFQACSYVDGFGKPADGIIVADVNIETSFGKGNVELKANPLIIPVTVSLPEITGRESGQIIDLPINIKIPTSSENFFTFANAKITDVTIVLNTPRSALDFDGFSGVGDWKFNVTNINGDRVTIHGTGSSVVEGDFCKPRVKILVSKYPTIPVSIESIVFGGRECCIVPTTTNGSIAWTACAADIRGAITTSGTKFVLSPVMPNPVTSSSLDINYGVGFETSTKIEIFDAAGNLVKEVFNGIQKDGNYTANVDVTTIPTGTYTIRMKSGPFEETQSLIILK